MKISERQVDDVKAAVLAGVPMVAIVATSGMTEDEILGVVEIPKSLGCDVLDAVKGDLLAEGDVAGAASLARLDAGMIGLAERVVSKLNILTLVSTDEHQLLTVVEALAKLRGAFFEGGIHTQVNIQNVSGGGDGDGGGLGARLKR